MGLNQHLSDTAEYFKVRLKGALELLIISCVFHLQSQQIYLQIM